jgi:hypothetical protein
MCVALKCGIDSFDDTSVDLHYCGPLDHVCQHCGALGFDGENKATKKNEVHFGNMCCNQGNQKSRNCIRASRSIKTVS